MKSSLGQRLTWLPSPRALLWVGLALVAQTLVCLVVFYFFSVSQAKNFIHTIVERVHEDIRYKDGQWDTSRYDADPEIPGNYRLYLITKDGFVIDRWRPIPNYLDTSDFKQLITYTTPGSLHAVTGQDWRLVSVPIMSGDKTVGVVTTGRFQFSSQPVDQSDQELKQVATHLASQIKTKGTTINIEAINVRDVPYTVSFQVVDQFNKILTKSDNSNSLDRLPSFIDPSYIVGHLKSASVQRLTDSKNHETFIIESSPITDDSHSVIGTVIVARTISPMLDVLKSSGLVAGLLIPLTLIGYGFGVHRYEQAGRRKTLISKSLSLEEIASISFDKERCGVLVNDRLIPLSYATNQYYLCQILSAAPKKKWEVDELVEKMGDSLERESWRKLYDAHVSINKKMAEILGDKLIIVNNKTFAINSRFVPKIRRAS